MYWENERFKLLETKVRETIAGKRHILDVPYYIFLYKPEFEVECLKEFRNFELRLKRDNISVETISLASLMVDSLDSLGCLKEDFIKTEEKMREEITEDLKRELLKEISYRLREKLKGKDISHCAILIRAGSLFPFVHISSLLGKLEGAVRCTLIIPYPGNKEGNMLNYQWENIRTYYRGEII